MIPLLMFPDRSVEARPVLPGNAGDLIGDLELVTVFNAMGNGDEFLANVAKNTLLMAANNSVETILYRQRVLEDCIHNEAIVRSMYDLAVKTLEEDKRVYFGYYGKHPHSILNRGIRVLAMALESLRQLRTIADTNAATFNSTGFRNFFEMVRKEMDDTYFETAQRHLEMLRFRDGVLIGAHLGRGNKGSGYTLRRQQEKKRTWLSRFLPQKASRFSFTIADRDESGAKALSNLRDQGINVAANVVAQSADHILAFFEQLRIELAFYVGCLNLREHVLGIGGNVCFPTPLDHAHRAHRCVALYDVCLALRMKKMIVSNTIDAGESDAIIITGANQGGKSTFLRSIGVAQLMMQSGMFVTAADFHANTCTRLFTHYKREEDAEMNSGKFDEELARMSAMVDELSPDAMVLFNESFASTNDREGSEIAIQIVRAMLEHRIKIFYVTHLYEFAHTMHETQKQRTRFLRAERAPDGTRTFKLVEGAPSETSSGTDLYWMVFGEMSHHAVGSDSTEEVLRGSAMGDSD